MFSVKFLVSLAIVAPSIDEAKYLSANYQFYFNNDNNYDRGQVISGGPK